MLTSKDLLIKALDYDGFWNSSKRIRESEPSKARWLQLSKLLSIFSISKKNLKSESQMPYITDESSKSISFYLVSGKTKSISRHEYVKTLSDFRYFSTGEFLADLDAPMYNLRVQEIINQSGKSFVTNSDILEKKINLVSFFSTLYNFRLSIHQMLTYSKMTNIDHDFQIEHNFSSHLIEKFGSSITDNLTEIDNLLCLLVDPEQKEFNEMDISFPIYDFQSLDVAWRKANF